MRIALMARRMTSGTWALRVIISMTSRSALPWAVELAAARANEQPAGGPRPTIPQALAFPARLVAGSAWAALLTPLLFVVARS
jgi:hypothetical protein